MFATTPMAQTASVKPAAKAVEKPAAKAAKPRTKPAARKVAPVPVVVSLAKAEGEQLAAAALTYYGDYSCEFQQTINVNTTPNNDGYVDVRLKNQTWTMKPVLSSTGALRLEDVRGQMLMIQIANKSMLLDTKLGQRVVDECVHETQRAAIAAAAAAAASQPAGAGLLQAPAPAPDSAAATAATAAASAASAASASAASAAASAAAAAASAPASAPLSAPAPASVPSAPR